MTLIDRAAICVIGGGIYGLTAAYYLCRAGCDVLVVERKALAMEASRSNAGSLGVQNKAHRMLSHTLRAVERWKNYSDELGMDIGYERLGGYKVGHSETDAAALEAQVPVQRNAGVPLELVSGAALRKECPHVGEGVLAATYCPLDGLCNPLLANQALAQAIKRLGGRFLTFAPVEGVRRSEQAILLETPKGVVAAEKVVNAAGAWAGAVSEMMGVPIPITWVVNTVSITDPGPTVIPHLFTHVRGNLTVKQHDGRILIGGAWRGDGEPFEGQPVPNWPNLRGNLAWACQTIPAIKRFRLLRSWVGLQGNSPDRLFVMGEIPPYDGRMFVMAGGSGGYTLAPIIGELMAHWILKGSAPQEAALFDVRRFFRAARRE
jgi:glycine/D-amino acid oxidase-like deaminating enzyme